MSAVARALIRYIKDNAIGSKVCIQHGLCIETMAQKFKKETYCILRFVVLSLEAGSTVDLPSQIDWHFGVYSYIKYPA